MTEITEKNIRYGLTFESKSKVTVEACLLGETCLFCNKPEKSYRPGPDIEFICGTCVQSLLHADQEDLKRAYKKALDKGCLRNASALKTFLMPEDIDGKRPTKKRLKRKGTGKSTGRCFNRKRVTRSIRA